MSFKKLKKKIFSKEEQVENFTLRKKYRVLGFKFSHKYNAEEYFEIERIRKQNSILYADLSNRVKRYKKITLYFDHSLGGGTETYFNNQLRHLDKSEIIIRIQYMTFSKCYKLTLCGACKYIEIFEANLAKMAREIAKVGVDEIYVNNLVGYSSVKDVFDTVAYFKQKNSYLRIILMGHDFYSICPQWNLLDEKFERCKFENCTNDYKKCIQMVPPVCYPKKVIVDEKFSLNDWRKLWLDFINEYADEVRCFSPSSREIFEKVYPDIKGKITLVPHKIEPFKNTLNVAFIGNFSVHKGAVVIEKLLNYLNENNIWDIHIYVFGRNMFKDISSPYLSILGPYSREDLPALMKEKNIDTIIVPSICDETFSYTTAESIAMGYPVCCFDFGGQGDQVRNYSKGYIIPSFEPEDVYKTLKMSCQIVNEEKIKDMVNG